MAGTIKHQWNGTILTITSDSGTSSCDLKGDKGDDGVRGAQGIAGTNGADGIIDYSEIANYSAAKNAVRYNGTSTTTEADFEAWLNEQLANMGDYEAKYIAVYAPSFITSNSTYHGWLYKQLDNAAVWIGESRLSSVKKRLYNGVWSAVEFNAPLMSANVEYATTERIKGNVVYTKFISVDALPNTDSIAIATGATGASKIVSVVGYTTNGTYKRPFPAHMSSDGALIATWTINSSGNILLYTYQNMSSYSAYFIVKYIK